MMSPLPFFDPRVLFSLSLRSTCFSFFFHLHPPLPPRATPDINNLLNSGEVPNLFTKDDLAEIGERCAADSRKARALAGAPPADTPDAVHAFFVDRCRRNVHVVVCFSPIGRSQPPTPTRCLCLCFSGLENEMSVCVFSFVDRC